MKLNFNLVKMKFHIIISIITTVGLSACSLQTDQSVHPTEQTSTSLVAFESNGYLKPDRIEPLRKEQVRIKAISAYEYALPIVGLEQWHEGFLMEAKYGDWLIYETRESKIPIITANITKNNPPVNPPAVSMNGIM